MLDPATVEQVNELRAQVGQFTIPQPLHWAGSGHGPGRMASGRVARLELELHTAVRRHARRSSAQHVGVLMLQRSERSIVGAMELQLRVREAERGEMQLHAVLEQLHAVGEALDVVRLCQGGRPGRRRARAACTCAASRAASAAWAAGTGRDHPDDRRGGGGGGGGGAEGVVGRSCTVDTEGARSI